MNNYRYKVTIWTNEFTKEFETDDLSPANLDDILDLQDDNFIVDAEVLDKETGKVKTLTDDGIWNFV